LPRKKEETDANAVPAAKLSQDDAIKDATAYAYTAQLESPSRQESASTEEEAVVTQEEEVVAPGTGDKNLNLFMLL
jgi:hypothetical protein